MPWRDHVAVVTGAGAGIGKAVAERFAQAGAKVVVADRDATRGEAVAEELRGIWGTGLFQQVDVARGDDCRALIQRVVDEYGRIDTLVNNAGVNFVKPTLELDEDDWDYVINTDLRGTFLLCRYALEQMTARGRGSIVNVASVHVRSTLPQAALYAAAKSGVEGLTRALALEFAPQGIRVNCVSPGLTDTLIWEEIQAKAEDAEEARQHWFDNIPMRRVQSPREVSNVIFFLASPEASYVTGATIYADGGMTAQLVSTPRYASGPIDGEHPEVEASGGGPHAALG